MRIDVAVGEVPWERELLTAIAANRDVQMGRRLVDIATTSEATDVLITCPSVRGFDQEAVLQRATQTRVVVLRDSIRPPWLDGSDLDVRDVVDVMFDELIAECAQLQPTPRLQLVRAVDRAPITAFVGVSGGVGGRTLAWMYARQHPNALLIEGNVARPALGLLVGTGTRTSTLRMAVRELDRNPTADLRQLAVPQAKRAAVLALALHGDDGTDVSPSDVARLLVVAAEQFPEVVIDFGPIGGHPWEGILDHVDRLVVVATATPLGLVRLCAHSGAWSQHPTAIVVNRIRESAAGSRHVAAAMRNLVEAELGQAPTLVGDFVADCDRGWLSGHWGAMEHAVGALHFARSA